MTIRELSQLYHLNREVEMEQQRLESLRAKAESATTQLTGMPGAHNAGSKVEYYGSEIVDLEGIILAKRQQCIHERNRLERYINDIDDSLTRQIFRLRFINGLGWEQVAACIGGNNTDKSVSKRCYTYIKTSLNKASNGIL